MEREQLKKEIAFLELCIKNNKNLISDLKQEILESTQDLNNTVADSNSRKRLLARYKDELAEAEEVEVEIRYSVIEEKTEKVRISAVEFLQLKNKSNSDIFFELESRFMKDVKNYQEESFEIEGNYC